MNENLTALNISLDQETSFCKSISKTWFFPLLSCIISILVFFYLLVIIQSQYETVILKPDFRRIYSSIYDGTDGFDAYYRVFAGNLSAQNLILRLQFSAEREPIPLLNQSMMAHVTLMDENFTEISSEVSVDVPYEFKGMERIGYFVASTISLAPLRNTTNLTIKLHYEGNATYINGMHFNIGAIDNPKIYQNMISSGDILSFATLVAVVVCVFQGILVFNSKSLYAIILAVCSLMATNTRSNPDLTAAWQAALTCCIRALAPAVSMNSWWKSYLIFILFVLVNGYPVYKSEQIFNISAGDWLTPLGWGLSETNDVDKKFLYFSIISVLIFLIYALITKRGTELIHVGTVTTIVLIALFCRQSLCQQRSRQYEIPDGSQPEVRFPAGFFQEKYTAVFAGLFLSLLVSSPLEVNLSSRQKKQTDENESLLPHSTV